MFGVDCFDQNNNHLRIAMGGKKWYWPVVTWLLNTSVHNAWQLHKRSGGTMKLLSFKRELVCAIPRSAAATHTRRIQTGPLGTRPGGDDIRYDQTSHFIKRCDLHRLCAMEDCALKCHTYCGKCDRSVYMGCFERYHTRS
jgi:hypothetical protein